MSKWSKCQQSAHTSTTTGFAVTKAAQISLQQQVIVIQILLQVAHTVSLKTPL